MPDTRAILFMPKATKGSHGRFSFAYPDALGLRPYALYWDEIDMPWEHHIYQDDRLGKIYDLAEIDGIFPVDYEFLERSGILRRFGVSPAEAPKQGPMTPVVDSMFVATMDVAHTCKNLPPMLLDHINAMDRQRGRTGVTRVLGGFDGSWSLPGQDTHTYTIELYKALPMPSATTPIGTILEFKERHSIELATLRFHLDELARRISSSGDAAEALKVCSREIDGALSSLHRGFQSDGIQSLHSRLDISIPVTSAVAGAVAACFSSGAGCVVPLLVSLLPSLNSAIKLARLKRVGSVTGTNHPLEYSYYVSREL